MAERKFRLNALGVYLLGYDLERLEWAIATVNDCIELASYFGNLRGYEEVDSFEDIGREAKSFHDTLSGLKEESLGEIKNTLRDIRARWHTLARERLQDFYLVTPSSRIDPRCLMKGIKGSVGEEHLALLEPIEISDLNEACMCILVGSATAAEHIALRAAESLLRRWYEHQTGRKLKRATWGTVLDELVQEYPEKNRPKEIALLGYLKQRRDEVAHPERVSSLMEAEATLLNVCSLVGGIESVLVRLVPLTEPDIQLPMSQNQSNGVTENER